MRDFPRAGIYELERVARLVRVHASTGPGFDPSPCAVATKMGDKVDVVLDSSLFPPGLSGPVVARCEVTLSGEDRQARLGQLKDAVRQVLR